MDRPGGSVTGWMAAREVAALLRGLGAPVAAATAKPSSQDPSQHRKPKRRRTP
jgi:hypothetical protein